ncbi:MAG: DUF4830 domain-containing protein [Clostridia bacterium]|nr:DUF4830 domain-containing protein [Clostridia bacterium]MBR2296909.1 DUF4830 domain-containing protein [Clostridia bacterium]
MFIYSFKASTLKFFGVIGVAVIVLVALVFLIPTYSKDTTAEIALFNESISFDNVENASDGKRFLSQYGWEVEDTPVEECEITVPKDFDKVLSSYNEIQKQQGLDLTKYAKKTANRYTYKVTNYPNYDGTVYANIIIYKDKVIAGDICSADARGFIHTLSMPKPSTNE